MIESSFIGTRRKKGKKKDIGILVLNLVMGINEIWGSLERISHGFDRGKLRSRDGHGDFFALKGGGFFLRLSIFVLLREV